VPIHDLGYRAWKGQTTSELLRWWVITQTGLRIAWKNFWLRRLLFVAWLPAAYVGVGFFIYEHLLTRTSESIAATVETQGAVSEEAREALMSDAVTRAEREMRNQQIGRIAQSFLPGFPLSPDRHEVWCWLMYAFFRYPQGLIMLLVIGLVAPPLVARDVGSRAFLLYFSRPISRAEYIFGKLAIVWAFVLLITTAPAITLFLLGVLLSPELSVLAYTWDLPFRILIASAVLLIPTTTIALAFSSATTKTWIAGFAWFAVWIFGFMAYIVLLTTAQHQARPLGEQWVLISLYHTLGKVQAWVFGVEGTLASVLPSAGLLAALTVLSLMVLYRRVSSPMRI
jgi:hypothetical protein